MTNFESIIQKSLNNKNEGDRIDSEGFLVCGVCGERKQLDVNLYKLGNRRVGRACKCDRDRLEQEREIDRRERFVQRMERLWDWGICSEPDKQSVFSNDDNRNPELTKFCKDYVEHWEEMLKLNVGILFMGDVGTGKTFYAHCIANGLLEKCVPVCVTNIPRILNHLQGFNTDKQSVIDDITGFKFLVLDDFGVERDTSYSLEQVYNIINERVLAKKPTIITTNLTKTELTHPSSTMQSRIYSRLSEMCSERKVVDGASRRPEIAKQRREAVKELFGGEK